MKREPGPLQLLMTTPASNTPSSSPAPRLPKLLNKSRVNTAGLLGRTGSGGLGGTNGLAPTKPAASFPTGEPQPEKRPTHADSTGPTPSAMHTGKPETRRPTGRAISGG